MKYPVIYALTFLLFTGCIGGVSTKDSITDQYFAQRRKSMDILELLDTLTYVTRDTANLPYPYDGSLIMDWKSPREIREINWLPYDAKNYRDTYFGNYTTLRGELYITMDSAFTNLDVERDGPLPWSLMLSGVTRGYLYIILDNNVLSDNFCGFEYFFDQKKVLVSDSVLPYKGATATNAPFTKMEIKIKNRIITLYQLTSEGSAGCITWLFLNSNGSRRKLPPSDFLK